MLTPPPSHAHHPFFPNANGEWRVGGIPLEQLALRVGQTPFYAYDRQTLTQRSQQLRQQMPGGLKIYYALKANPMPAVVQHLASLTDGFDIASGGELKTALDSGMPPTHISFAGPGKSRAELQQAIAAGVTVNIESARELQTIDQLCTQTGLTAKLAVRLNPAFELKSAGLKMGGGPKPFGIDAEQAPAILRRIHNLGLEFQGLHIYSGSQNLNPAAIIAAQQNCLQLALDLSADCPTPIRALNIGGGFGVPYFPGEQALDVTAIGAALDAAIADFRQQLPETEVVIELGRYLVAEAGLYVTRIVDKKISRGQIFLVTDGGLHQHLAASGNFGQVIRKNYPVSIVSPQPAQHTETVSIVGPLCTPLDILAANMTLPKAEIGDLVVIRQSGAYGYTASPQRFLSMPPAVEVLV